MRGNHAPWTPVDLTPIPVLFPHLYHGRLLAFWNEELAMDLEQERALAVLEGREPEAAAKAYRTREEEWFYVIHPLEESEQRGRGFALD